MMGLLIFVIDLYIFLLIDYLIPIELSSEELVSEGDGSIVDSW